MLKYVDTAITFAEFPDEVSLCINISSCPCFCDGCHSPYLSKDIGEVLSLGRLQELIEANTIARKKALAKVKRLELEKTAGYVTISTLTIIITLVISIVIFITIGTLLGG